MFKKAASLLRNATSGRAVEDVNRTPVSKLADHWKYLHVTFYQQNARADVEVHDTEWPKRLREIHNILAKEEESHGTDKPCMEYFLRENIMHEMLVHVEKNIPVGLISTVVDFSKNLIGELSYPLLENTRILEMLFKLLDRGLKKSFGQLSLEQSLVDLMFHMSDKLQANSSLISLFFFDFGHDTSSSLYAINGTRPPKERAQRTTASPGKPPQPGSASAADADFPLFVHLMHFVSHPGRIGSTARTAMLLCVEASAAAKLPTIDEYLIHKLFFPSSIASILSSLYEALWGTKMEKSEDLQTTEAWSEFSQLFKLCQSVMEKGSPLMAAGMASSIEDLFCEKSLYGRLFSADPSVAIQTTFHVELMLECITSTWLSRELCVFLLGDPSTMLTHDQPDLFVRSRDERPPIKRALLSRLSSDNTELMWATWRLIYKLFSTQIVEAVPLLMGSAVQQRVESYGRDMTVDSDISLRYLALLPNEDDLGEEYVQLMAGMERSFRANYKKYQQYVRCKEARERNVT